MVKTAKEILGGKNLKVVFDDKVNGFIIMADGEFIVEMIEELVAHGVRGSRRFPRFGEFLDTVQDAM